jgi:hypothetical protein
MTVTRLDLKVTADAKAAVAGLKPLTTSLEGVTKTADKTESALNDLGQSHKVSINDAAVENARKEIKRLRDEMRQKLSMDATADTTKAQRRIRQLESSIRTLDRQDPDIKVNVESDEAEGKLRTLSGSVKGLFAGLAGVEGGKQLFNAALGADQFANNLKGMATVLGQIETDQFSKWIDDNADALNLSESAAAEAGKSFAVYAKQVQDAGGDASDFTIGLVALSTQLAAFSGADPAEVISALGGALRGEFDPLEQFGIALTAAQVQAEALQMGLIGVGETMSNQDRILATNALLLERGAFAMGSVERNANSLTGKVSGLKQETADLAKSIGQDLAPGLEAAATAAGFTADKVSWLTSKWAEFRQELRDSRDDTKLTSKDFGDMFFSAGLEGLFTIPQRFRDRWIELFGDEAPAAIEQTGNSTEAAGDQAKQAAGKIDALTHAASGLKVSAEDAKKFEQALSDAFDSIGNIGANVRTRLNFVIDQDDLTEEINNAIAGSKKDKIKPVHLPVDIDMGDVAKLKDPQQQLLVNMGQLWANSIQRGMELEKLNPASFNLQKFLTDQSKNLDPLLLKAGVSPENLADVKSDILGIDPKIIAQVVADTKQAEIDAGKIPPPPPIKVPVLPDWVPVPSDPSSVNAPTVSITPTVLPPVFPEIVPPSVVITPTADVTQANTDLNGVANLPRASSIDAIMGADNASTFLDSISKDRTVTIRVNAVPANPGGADNNLNTPFPNSIVPQLFGSSAAVAGVRSAAARSAVVLGPGAAAAAAVPAQRGSVTQLRPKEVPIKIYLDGAEIADHLQLKAGRLATATTVRRRA